MSDVQRVEIQNGLNAMGEYKLAHAISALLRIAVLGSDTKAGIVTDLWDGPESVYGQLHAVNPQTFPVPSRPSTPIAPPALSPVITWGLTQIGKPYSGPIVGQPDSWRYGDPGYDCSSYVATAYKQVGIFLPAFTDAIAVSPALRGLSEAEAPVPGDIILYRYYDPYQLGVKYPHTGLWYSSQRMLSCDWGPGVGVGLWPLMAVPFDLFRAR